MHCARCGTELPAGARFCATCGTAVEAPLLPIWARVLGGLSAVAVGLLLVVTQVVPDRVGDVVGDAVAGTWDCELTYRSDDDPAFETDWEVEFFDDGRLTVSDRFDEAEGEWSYEDGELSVDFGDESDLGNPELTTRSIELESPDELIIEFERTDRDDEVGVGDRTLTCERED